MFYTFQSALYLHPKQEDKACITILKDTIDQINARDEIRLVPYGASERRILAETNTEVLLKKGGVIVLKETRKVRQFGLKEININCYILNAYKTCTLLKFDPIFSAVSKTVSLEIYSFMKQVLRQAIAAAQPKLAQLNGIGDEQQESILHPTQWEPGRLPTFLAPFNYIDRSLITAEAISQMAAVAQVTPYANGYLIEFSDQLSAAQISSFLGKAMGKKQEMVYSRIMP